MSMFLLRLFTLVCAVMHARGQLQGRIAGGTEVRYRCRDPYNAIVALRVSLQDAPDPIACSGVMIDRQHIVTVGHCIEALRVFRSSIRVIVGELDRYLTEPSQQTISIANNGIKLHEDYNATSGDDNIGLIRLSRPARLSSCVRPANPVTFDPTVAADNDVLCIMMGWGSFSGEDAPGNSRLLRQAPIRVLGQLSTRLSFLINYGILEPRGHLEAIAMSPTQKACLFDRGGMVSCVRNGFYTFRGLIAEANCNPVGGDVPLLVTDVPAYKTWIEDCLDDWDNCPATTY